MSEECTHDCSTCAANCESRDPSSFLKPLNAASKVGKVIAVVSGKGGVGKSMVTSLLAVTMARRGYSTAILDADITGPSIPRAFGLKGGECYGSDEGLEPSVSHMGTKVMSVNLLLEEETAPVVWRGPVIAGTVTQFWTDVHWGEVDYMFVDMPPGTGDVPLTVFQSLPVDGVVVVTSPQELVGMIVEKCVNMAGMMDKKVVGLVENMSYYKCPDCGGEHSIFGESHAQETAQRLNIPTVARLPIDPKLSAGCDKGLIELFEGDWLEPLADAIRDL